MKQCYNFLFIGFRRQHTKRIWMLVQTSLLGTWIQR